MAAVIEAEMEVVHFLASHPSPDQIIAFRPPQPVTERYYALIARAREQQISDEERQELEHYRSIEHMPRQVVRAANMKAQQRAVSRDVLRRPSIQLSICARCKRPL